MIDYNALAKQFGGTTNLNNTPKTGAVDYASLAKQFGGTTTPPVVSPPVKNPASNPYQSEGVMNSPLLKGFGEVIPAPFKSNESDGAIKSSAKTIGNIPTGTVNLATGIFDFLNPIKNLKEAGTNIADTITQVAQYASDNNEHPLKTIGKSLLGKDVLSGKPGAIPEIYKSAGQVLLPKFLQDIIKGDFENAKKSIVEHPVEEIAPLVLIASGVAEKAGMKPQFDKLMKDVSSPVIEPAKVGIDLTKQGLDSVKTSLQNKIIKGEINDWGKPTEVISASYNKANKISGKANLKGNDVRETIVNNKIKLQDNVQDGKYDTLDSANKTRTDAIKASNEILRPSLEEASPSVPKIPVEEVIKDTISNIKKSKGITAGDMESQISRAMAEGEALAKRYPDGMDLVNLHDEKIAYNSNRYSPIGIKSDANAAIVDRAFGRTFKKGVEKGFPEAEKFNAELEKQFQSADYLESLNTKKVPVSLTSKIAKTTAKVVGASVGAGMGGGVLGGVGGYHLGGVIESFIESAPNPLKSWALDNLKKTNPEAFAKVSEALGNMQAEKSNRLALPAPKSIIPPAPEFKGTTPEQLKALQAENNARIKQQGIDNTLRLPAPKNQINLESPEVVRGKKTLSEYENIQQNKKSFVKKIVETYKNNSERGAVANPLSNVSKKIISEGEQKPTIQLKRDVTVTTLTGEKAVIDAGEVLKAYEQGGKALLKDGREYIVSKSQYENIKNNSLKSEAKEFAPELKGTEETVKGGEFKGVKEAQAEFDKLNDKSTKLVIKYPREGRTPMQQAELTAIGDKMNALHDKYSGDYDFIAKQVIKRSDTKYSAYQLPEGKNYKEILIKAPVEKDIVLSKLPEGYKTERINTKSGEEAWSVVNEKGNTVTAKWYPTAESAANDYVRGRNVNAPDKPSFKSSHWDEPNVISHLRLNERTYKGKKVTFMEELQSDWAREGRSKGFAKEITKDTAKELGFSVNKSKSNLGSEAYFIDNAKDSYFYRKGFTNTGFDTEAMAWDSIVKKLEKDSTAVPNNPLLKNWQELSVKRALKEAVDNKSDYFAWINGEQTSARYNLATHVKEVKWTPPFEGYKSIEIIPQSGSEMKFHINKDGVIKVKAGDYGKGTTEWEGKKLDEVLGKGLADKIMADEKGTLSGEGLKFGGEWANNLYDKQLGNIVKDLTGAKVEVLDMGLPIDSKKAPTFHLMKNGGRVGDLTKANMKVGEQIADNTGQYHIITDILGDGKFKAVPKRYANGLEEATSLERRGQMNDAEISRMHYNNHKETFDISTKKTTQQGIKITPEIRAMIKGEAPKLLPTKKTPVKGLPKKN